MGKRVVVTGLGVVTPVGNDVPTMWEALLAGRSGADHITRFDVSNLDVRIAAEVKGFDPEALFGRRVARRNDRFALFALEAARQAIADAGLAVDNELGKSAGVIIGTSMGGMATLLKNYDVFHTSGPRRVSPFMAPMMMPNAASGAIAIAHGLRGVNLCVASACATGSHAVGEAAEVIRRGDAAVMLCGGSDAPLDPLSLASLGNMRALSTRNDEPTRASRPFDAQRDGFVIGEGAGVIVLEGLEHAQRRGARIYAELAGYGASADAFHITAPDEQGAGAVEAMRAALEDAGLRAESVDYINAHGTGTLLNDPVETQAIRTLFGSHADRLAVSSTKSMVGHLFGAAGAVEAVVCVKSLETGWVHPTINYEYPDPACDLDYVPNTARCLEPKVVLSNSFGFGGHNCCLVFRRWHDE
jgi:3-oxoacyl-[acyl-carrier-protein] synthase II